MCGLWLEINHSPFYADEVTNLFSPHAQGKSVAFPIILSLPFS